MVFGSLTSMRGVAALLVAFFTSAMASSVVIRKEAVMPNILPREKAGNSSDYIWIRIDADSQQILDQLTPAAEEILRDCAEGKAEAVISR
jgi:DNA-binding NarL/FixJ family response regulator